MPTTASTNAIEIGYETVDKLRLRVARRPGNANGNRVPLLVFNGIGANLELFFPLFEQLPDFECLIFDAPGVGGSQTPRLPMRFQQLTSLAAKLLDRWGIRQVDVLGVSWGGALAQEFAYRQSARCRRLILAATSPGAIMVPGRLSVLMKLASPRRYLQANYMNENAHHIYGGIFRDRPELITEFSDKVLPPDSKRGYYWQLSAGVGWTSIHWLHELRQPTLILAGNDDPLVPLINARIMHMRIPDCRLIELDCGHLFLFTLIDRVASLIQEFLSAKSPH